MQKTPPEALQPPLSNASNTDQEIIGTVINYPFFKIDKHGGKIAIVRILPLSTPKTNQKDSQVAFMAKGSLAEQIQRYVRPNNKILIVFTPGEKIAKQVKLLDSSK